MKTVVLIFCLVLSSVALVSCNAHGGKSDARGISRDGVAATAEAFIELLAKEDFSPAWTQFDPEMKAALPQEKLVETWRTAVDRVGAFKKRVSSRQGTSEGYDVVIVTCEFERSMLGVRVVFNGDRQISGLFFERVK